MVSISEFKKRLVIVLILATRALTVPMRQVRDLHVGLRDCELFLHGGAVLVGLNLVVLSTVGGSAIKCWRRDSTDGWGIGLAGFIIFSDKYPWTGQDRHTL